MAKNNFKHGMWNTPEYDTWCGMVYRCTNPKSKDYHRYGARGITVCDRWKDSFLNFFSDMGYRPFPKAQIDRIDNNKGYSPDNCRWVTNQQNCRNKRNSTMIEFNGVIKNLKEWSEVTGLPYYTLVNRIKRDKWCIEQALTLPVLKGDQSKRAATILRTA